MDRVENRGFARFTAELLENRRGFRDRSPKQIEQIVASIFSEFYNCEALHVGRSAE